MDILKKTQQDYNIIAEHFSQKRRFIWRDLRPFLNLVKPVNKVLDIGCGNGRLYGELKNKKINYLGLDFSQKLLTIAKKQYPQGKFKAGDLTQPKTWQKIKNFDICFCIAVLHVLPTPELQLKVLRFIHRSLKKDGLLVLSVWNLWQKRFWKMHCQQLLWKIKQGCQLRWLQVPYKITQGPTVNRFYYAFLPWELKNLVKKAGFRIEKTTIGRNLYLVARK